MSEKPSANWQSRSTPGRPAWSNEEATLRRRMFLATKVWVVATVALFLLLTVASIALTKQSPNPGFVVINGRTVNRDHYYAEVIANSFRTAFWIPLAPYLMTMALLGTALLATPPASAKHED